MCDATVKPFERLDATPDGKVYVGGHPFPGEPNRRPSWPPSYPPLGGGTTTSEPRIYPCLGTGYHDYAVGESAAVCNRCSEVKHLRPLADLRAPERGDHGG